MDATFGQRVYRSVRERAETEYIKAVEQGIVQPVILVDARDQDDRRARAEARDELPNELPLVHVGITIGPRAQIAAELVSVSRKAAEDLANSYKPGRPFTVVVISKTDRGHVEIFDEPDPR